MILRIIAFASLLLWSEDAQAASVAVTGTVLPAPTITMGVTAVLTGLDNNNANHFLAQKATLSQAATLQSLSFNVQAVGGSLRLGLYDATGINAGPGHLLAQTAAFVPVLGWNTQPVVTPVLLPTGTYWLAYLPSSNALGVAANFSTGSFCYTSFTFAALPATFPSGYTCGTTEWSIYASLTVAGAPPPTLLLNVTPPAPSIPATTPLGSAVATISPTWSDGSPFTGTVSFGQPYSNDGGTFAISGSNLIINPSGPGVSADANTVQNVTLVATQ